MLVETGVQEKHGTKKHMTFTLYTPPEKKLNIENDLLTQFWNPLPSFALFFSSFPAKASTQKRRLNGDMDGIFAGGYPP